MTRHIVVTLGVKPPARSGDIRDMITLRATRKTTGIVKTLLQAEKALTDPGVRRSPQRVHQLLHPDFVEIGSSGHVYDRETMIEMMTSERPGGVVIRDFEVHLLSDNTALVTYRSIGTSGKEARRSSIWVDEGSGWRLIHHQGTRVPNSWGAVS